MDRLTQVALSMLKSNPELVDDARQGARVNNSVVGGILSIAHHAPRWAAERAVREALAILDEGEEGDEDYAELVRQALDILDEDEEDDEGDGEEENDE